MLLKVLVIHVTSIVKPVHTSLALLERQLHRTEGENYPVIEKSSIEVLPVSSRRQCLNHRIR